MQIFAKKKKRRGFTLIELLVVIAIIGILASIVLVSLSSAKARAKDGRIIASMSQLRTAAEIVNQNDGDFDCVCYGTPPTGCTACNPDITTLADDIIAQGGTKPSDTATPYDSGLDIIKPTSPAAEYCAAVRLNSEKFYCVDSTLYSKQLDSLGTNCAGTDYTCQ